MPVAVEDIRAQVPTDPTQLTDARINALIQAAEVDVAEVAGPMLGMAARYINRNDQTDLILPKPAVSVTAVFETTVRGGRQHQLATNDWELQADNLRLRRLATGDLPRQHWGTYVTVTFNQVEDARRDQAVVQLVVLDIHFDPAVGSERLGDYQASTGGLTYQQQRAQIMKRIAVVGVS